MSYYWLNRQELLKKDNGEEYDNDNMTMVVKKKLLL